MQNLIDKLISITDQQEKIKLEKRELVKSLRDSIKKQKELELKIIELENN